MLSNPFTILVFLGALYGCTSDSPVVAPTPKAPSSEQSSTLADDPVKFCQQMVDLGFGPPSSLESCPAQLPQMREELGAEYGQFESCVNTSKNKAAFTVCIGKIEYLKKLRTQEARAFLPRLSKSASGYYATPEVVGDPRSPSAHILEKQFPPSAGPTPPRGSCCKTADHKCAASNPGWAAPAWQALDFAFLDPHYYSYEFVVASDGQSYEAKAYGDLDCDGVFSTFTLRGKVVDGEVQASSDLIEEQPLE